MSIRKRQRADYKAMIKNVYKGGKQKKALADKEAAAAAKAAGTVVSLDDKAVEEKKEEKSGCRGDKMTLGLPAEAISGASYLKYEVVMKNGNKVLVPESMFSMNDTAH